MCLVKNEERSVRKMLEPVNNWVLWFIEIELRKSLLKVRIIAHA